MGLLNEMLKEILNVSGNSTNQRKELKMQKMETKSPSYVSIPKPKQKSNRMPINEHDIEKAFVKAKAVFGHDLAKKLERLFRWETSHFKSGQFQKTYSPGMEATSEVYPYGWTSLRKFWDANEKYAPIGFVEMQENAGKTYDDEIDKFIQFPTIDAAVMSVGELLKIRGGNPGAWYSTNKDLQAEYNEKLSTIKNRYV